MVPLHSQHNQQSIQIQQLAIPIRIVYTSNGTFPSQLRDTVILIDTILCIIIKLPRLGYIQILTGTVFSK